MYSIGFVLFALVIIGIFWGSGDPLGSLMLCPAEGSEIGSGRGLSLGLNLILSRLKADLFKKNSNNGHGKGQTLLASGQTVSPSILPPQRIIIASRSCQAITVAKGHIKAAAIRNYEIIGISNKKGLVACEQYQGSTMLFLESNFFYRDTAFKLEPLKKQPKTINLIADIPGEPALTKKVGVTSWGSVSKRKYVRSSRFLITSGLLTPYLPLHGLTMYAVVSGWEKAGTFLMNVKEIPPA
jgi:hypothetical protein